MKKLAQIYVMMLFAVGLMVNFAMAQDQQKLLELPKQETPSPPRKPKPKFQFAKKLDGLFRQLKRTSEPKLAGKISTRIWEKWQQSGSKSIDLLTHWARQASGDNRFAQALDLLDQVILLRPKYAEGYNQRATVQYQMQNFVKSIADIERTLALEPRHYGAISGLASIFERLGQKSKALASWHRVLEIYPAMRSAQGAVIRLEEELAGSGI